MMRRRNLRLLNLTITAENQLAMYLAHVTLSVPQGRVAAAFGKDRTTVGYSCRVIEERRDDPLFDMTVAMLERVILAATQGRNS